MLHILMGRARTGKSERVLQRIAALGDSSQQILLVPEHASHVAEMDLCRVCGDTASRHAEALTFKLLASRVLGICGGGVGCGDDIVDAANAGADAVACAAVLHYKKETVTELKEDIRAGGVEVRQV